MPDYSGYTVESIRTAIQAGQPASLGQASTDFASAHTLLDRLAREIPLAVNAVTGGSRPAWEGKAAAAFRTVVFALTDFLEAVTPMLTPYKTQLSNGETALHIAQGEIGTATTDAEAQSILTTLALRYLDICPLLNPIATTPAELTTLEARRSIEPNSSNTSGRYNGILLDGDPSILRTELAGYTGPSLTLGSAQGSSAQFSGNGSLSSLTGTEPHSPFPYGRTGSAGLNPSTSLTTVRRIAGIGAVSGGSPMTANPSPMAGLLAGGGRGSALLTGQSRKSNEPQETGQVRLVGDEEWTEQVGVTGAIGRPEDSGGGHRA